MAGETEGEREEAEILGDGEGPLTLIKLQRQSAKPRTSKRGHYSSLHGT